MNNSFEGMKDAAPAVRRLHVEILANLFYVHQADPESQVCPTILNHLGSDSQSTSPTLRSAVALLCGSILRVFASAGNAGAGGDGPAEGDCLTDQPVLPCQYLRNIVPSLLRLAKETSQPVI